MNSIPETQTEGKTFKEMALARFENFDSWLRESSTIYNSDTVMAWIKNQGGFCVLQAMKHSPKLSGRKYSQCLTIGFWDPGSKMWEVSPNLETDYQTWVQSTKQLFNGNGRVVA